MLLGLGGLGGGILSVLNSALVGFGRGVIHFRLILHYFVFCSGDLHMTWLPRSAAGVRRMAWFSLRTPKVRKM